MIPGGIERQHVLKAMEQIDREGVPPERESRRYCLLHNDRVYPPKYVICLACRIALSRELHSEEFGGGQEANSWLRHRGFTIVDRDSLRSRCPDPPVQELPPGDHGSETHDRETRPILYEEDVIDATCAYLEKRNFNIEQRLTATERGDDIVASRADEVRVFVEAKGEGSSQEHTARYGQAFGSAQIRVHVAEAFFRAARMRQQPCTSRQKVVGVAFPATRNHRRLVEEICESLETLGIEVFFISHDRSVEVLGTSRLFA
jgi:5-methylcytosine-specific restriction protein B